MLPTLLALYDETYDGPVAVGWKLIAWALQLPGDHGAVTIAVGGPTSVTLWASLEDAVTALDAHVDEVNPRHVRAWEREQS